MMVASQYRQRLVCLPVVLKEIRLVESIDNISFGDSEKRILLKPLQKSD
jgi:hypothetical protein